MGDSDTEVNLDEITDESLLQNLVRILFILLIIINYYYYDFLFQQLDQTEDIDDRKAIRNRIQELRSSQKGENLFALYNCYSILQYLWLSLQFYVKHYHVYAK